MEILLTNLVNNYAEEIHKNVNTDTIKNVKCVKTNEKLQVLL